MSRVLLGNIISFVGAMLMVSIGLIKKRKNILIVQSVQFGVYGISNLILGGVSGAVSNGLGIIRNLFCLKYKLSFALGAVFLLAQAGLTLIVNKIGIAGWLPAVSTLALILSINSKDETKLKLAIIVGQLCWAVYDFIILNYVSMAFDGFAVFSNLWGIISIRRARRAENEQR